MKLLHTQFSADLAPWMLCEVCIRTVDVQFGLFAGHATFWPIHPFVERCLCVLLAALLEGKFAAEHGAHIVCKPVRHQESVV